VHRILGPIFSEVYMPQIAINTVKPVYLNYQTGNQENVSEH